MEHLRQGVERSASPVSLPLVWATPGAARQADLLADHRVKQAGERADVCAFLTAPVHPSLRLLVGIDRDTACGHAHRAHRHTVKPLPPVRFGQAAAL
jgi:hypothetical protein